MKSTLIPLAVAAAAAVLLDSVPAAAGPDVPAAVSPDPPAVDIEVRQGAPVLDEAAVRAAVARELSAQQAGGPSAGHLSIAVERGRRVVMTFRDATGREVLRAMTLPRDPAAAVGLLALLAGNLARNEAASIAALLAGASSRATPPALDAARAADARPTAPAPPPAAPDDARSALTLPTVVLPAYAITRRAHRAAPARPAAAPSTHAGRLGLHAIAGAVTSLGATSAAATGALGASYRWRWAAIGAEAQYAYGIIGRGIAESTGSFVGAAATVTAFGTIGPVQLGGGVGAGVVHQVRDLPVNAVVRGIGRASLALSRQFDVLAQVEVDGLYETAQGRFTTLMFGGGLGVQARLLP